MAIESNLHIATNPESYRPVMTNHFDITIFGLDGMRNYASSDPKAVIKESKLTLSIATDTFQGPTISQQAIPINKGNLTIEFPGRMDAHTSTATFHVFVKKSAFDILYSWKMASGNNVNGLVGNPQDYWKVVEIDVTTGDKGLLVGTWRYQNCWLQSLQEVTFNNGANEVKTANVTMKYFRPQWINGIE